MEAFKTLALLDEIKAIERKMKPDDIKAVEVMFDGVRVLEEEDFESAHNFNKQIRKIALGQARRLESIEQKERAANIVKKTHLFDAPYVFDSYLQYVEWDRDISSKFYIPRRNALKIIVDALQDLSDDKLDLLGISLPPGVGKTTIAIFFLTWIAGKDPNSPILGGSHSNSLLRGIYDECLRIIKPEGEYLWNDVFPGIKIVQTNALDMKIDLDKAKRFSTFQFSSVESGNAGKVRAHSLLYCDDLCNGLEQALSKDRLDNLWGKYTVDLKQRKIGDCKELHIATKWSVHDVISRLEQEYEGNPRVKFISIPAVDENGESNFDYDNGAGFSTEFFEDTKRTMDDASWRALYLNQPIEREGILYPEDELQRYFELPDMEPDSIIAVCDTKDTGKDFQFLPVAIQFGGNYYIEDCVCNNYAIEILDEQCADMLVKHNVQWCRFESNSAGGRVADRVLEKVKERGGNTHITKKFTTANKETKILVNSPFVKQRFFFKDSSQYSKDSDYAKMIRFMCGYTLAGKNRFDDVPDGLAQLSEFIQSLAGNRVSVFRRPF